MTWQQALFAHISGDSAITAILGTSPCMFVPARPAQAVKTYPRATYLEVVGVPDVCLTGATGTDHVRLQVDVYAKTRDSALALKELIRSRMEQPNSAFSSTVVTDEDGPVENELEVFRRLLEFNLWTTL